MLDNLLVISYADGVENSDTPKYKSFLPDHLSPVIVTDLDRVKPKSRSTIQKHILQTRNLIFHCHHEHLPNLHNCLLYNTKKITKSITCDRAFQSRQSGSLVLATRQSTTIFTAESIQTEEAATIKVSNSEQSDRQTSQ